MTQWQVDFVGPLPLSENASSTLTAADTATGFLFGHARLLYRHQHGTLKARDCLIAMYGHPLIIESGQGTHFTRREVRDWVQRLGIQWAFHVPYHPQAKVYLVKAMVFPVVLYGCESWTIKKAKD